MAERGDEVGEERSRNAERMKFFTDAVVAIAMTLLILPLLESVSDAASHGLATRGFVHEHHDQLLAFVLSFVVIARFWVAHEEVFDHVGHWSPLLMVLNVLWMLAVVFLPVVTAMVGSMDTDRLQIVLYVGTMLLATLLMGAMLLVVRRDPSTWSRAAGPGLRGIAANLTLTVLFGVALVLALLVPSVGYLWLLLLLLADPLQTVVQRRLERA